MQDWVESGRTFSESDIKEIAKKLLDILDYLHHRQPPVIHRDLKPSNILLADRSGNSPGEVYLIDFGSVQTVPSKRMFGNTDKIDQFIPALVKIPLNPP